MKILKEKNMVMILLLKNLKKSKGWLARKLSSGTEVDNVN